MDAKRVDFYGMDCFCLENDFLRVIVALHSGDVLDYVNKKSGCHQFWIDEDWMKAGSREYGIRLPWVGKPGIVEKPACVGGACAAALRAATDSLAQTFAFALDSASAALRIVHTLENTSGEVQYPDPRMFYYFNVASQAEKSDLWSKSLVRFNSMTSPNGRHRVFVGKECRWPGGRYWENHEAGEDVYEPKSYREQTYTRPRWVAVVDAGAAEGAAVRLDRPAGFARSWVPGFAFSYAITVEHDFQVGSLAPGESKTFGMEVAALNGLSRVDHVGPSCALEVDLTAALRLHERQRVTVRGAAFRPGAVKGTFMLRTTGVDVAEDFVLEMFRAGDTAERTWTAGPYGSRERLEAVWYYAHKKPGDCARPTPRVELCVDGQRVDRWFAPSPENEEILERMEGHVKGMDGRAASGEAPREMASALRVFLEQAEELRRERIDPDGMYALLDRAESVATAGIPEEGFRLFAPDEVRAAAGKGAISPVLQDVRRGVLEEGDAFYALGAPGRRAYMHHIQLAHHAACAAICSVCFEDAECAGRAVRSLMAFADDFARFRLIATGAILHLSVTVPSLVIAYDVVRHLLSPGEEVKLQRYLFWLAELLEGHVNAKGDNDEIFEAGALGWLAARFPYLSGSARRLRRAQSTRRAAGRKAPIITRRLRWPTWPRPF